MAIKPRNKIRAEFSMSSMTDIIFLLLIFFIVTSTVVKEPALKILLPKGTKTNVVNQIVKVYVDKDLNYKVENQNVSKGDLPLALKKVLTKNPGATVSVHADKSVEYDKVMELVREADKLEAKVVLALRKE